MNVLEEKDINLKRKETKSNHKHILILRQKAYRQIHLMNKAKFTHLY